MHALSFSISCQLFKVSFLLYALEYIKPLKFAATESAQFSTTFSSIGKVCLGVCFQGLLSYFFLLYYSKRIYDPQNMIWSVSILFHSGCWTSQENQEDPSTAKESKVAHLPTGHRLGLWSRTHHILSGSEWMIDLQLP